MTFVPNPDFQKELGRQPEYQDAVQGAAEAVRDSASQQAQAIGAPWMRRGNRETIEVQGSGATRQVVNTDYAGHLMEFGGRFNPPHALLRRAVAIVGLRFAVKPKG